MKIQEEEIKKKEEKRSIIADRHDGKKVYYRMRCIQMGQSIRTNSNNTMHYCKDFSIML